MFSKTLLAHGRQNKGSVGKNFNGYQYVLVFPQCLPKVFFFPKGRQKSSLSSKILSKFKIDCKVDG